jgi:hypothetical protein
VAQMLIGGTEERERKKKEIRTISGSAMDDFIIININILFILLD